MPWTLIDRTYRIGHAVLWEQLSSRSSRGSWTVPDRLDLLRVISHFLFQYVDHVADGLANVHQTERDRQIRGRERRRIAWVREVLADVAGSDSGGDYMTSAASISPPLPGGRTTSARSATSGSCSRRWCSSCRTRAAPPGAGRARSIAPSWPKVTRELALPADTVLALGAPAAGAAGFRLSHRQALEAARVLRRTGAPHGSYDDVSLEALVLRDERAAQDFVSRELGPLLDDGKRTRILLETLDVYVSSGWSAASAGARLGVHERTVGYRIATIEQRLGRPLAARREELGVALRLHTTFIALDRLTQ